MIRVLRPVALALLGAALATSAAAESEPYEVREGEAPALEVPPTQEPAADETAPAGEVRPTDEPVSDPPANVFEAIIQAIRDLLIRIAKGLSG